MTRLVPRFATAAAVAALLVLGTGAASAQSMAPSGAPPVTHNAPANNDANANNQHSSAPATRQSSSTPMKNPLASEDISQIEGTSVAGSDGSKIGSVANVLMDPASKKVDRLVVAEGGVLGVGAHNVALPVDSFRWDAQNHNFVIQKTADDLKSMPEWQKPQLAENPNASAPSSSASTSTVGAGAAAAPVAPIAPGNTGGGSNPPAH